MVIRRRQLLQGLAAAAAGSTLGYSSPHPAGAAGLDGTAMSGQPRESAKPPERPNILLLCIDDLRDWVGYLNEHPGVYTPNIDRLRQQ